MRAAHMPVFKLLGGGGILRLFTPQGWHTAPMGEIDSPTPNFISTRIYNMHIYTLVMTQLQGK